MEAGTGERKFWLTEVFITLLVVTVLCQPNNTPKKFIVMQRVVRLKMEQKRKE